MTKEQIIECGFITAFINEYFEDKIHSFYPDKDRLLYILCDSVQEKKVVTKEQIEDTKAKIFELGFEDLSFAYLLSCKPESSHNYIEPNKRFDFWLQRFSEDFENNITDFDPITQAVCLYKEVSKLSVEVYENESEFWEWYPKEQCPKTRSLLSIIPKEIELLSLIVYDIQEYNKNEYWEFDFEEYKGFIDVSKPIKILFNLCELLVQLNRLEMFNEFNLIPQLKFNEIVKEINNAFFRLESFMNNSISEYNYFGFIEAFTTLFSIAKNPENFTYQNCKLILKYWELSEQLRIDFDKGNYKNSSADKNEMFCKDCEEIMYLNWDCKEFEDFFTYDENEENERKFTIRDIIKNETLPNQQSKKSKPEQETPKTFDELFYNIELVQPYIDVLKEIEPPLVDTDYNYIGKLKGIVCVWIDELQRQGIVKHYSDRKIFASLIPQKIKRFSIDESMFGKHHIKAENNYRTDIKTKISKIKLSQNSQ